MEANFLLTLCAGKWKSCELEHRKVHSTRCTHTSASSKKRKELGNPLTRSPGFERLEEKNIFLIHLSRTATELFPALCVFTTMAGAPSAHALIAAAGWLAREGGKRSSSHVRIHELARWAIRVSGSRKIPRILKLPGSYRGIGSRSSVGWICRSTVRYRGSESISHGRSTVYCTTPYVVDLCRRLDDHAAVQRFQWKWRLSASSELITDCRRECLRHSILWS